MLAASGSALAQANNGTTDGDAASGTVVGGGAEGGHDMDDAPDSGFSQNNFAPSSGIGECGTGGIMGGGGLGFLEDTSLKRATELSSSQRVDIEEDDVLLGIALAHNGADDIDFNSLRDFTRTASRSVSADRVADLDRDDVFSALALGVDAEASNLEALACVSDLTVSSRETITQSRTMDLDEETVLLAIALGNSVDSPLSLDDVADIDESEVSATTREVTTDVDKEDTFLALALGAGGDNGGI